MGVICKDEEKKRFVARDLWCWSTDMWVACCSVTSMLLSSSGCYFVWPCQLILSGYHLLRGNPDDGLWMCESPVIMWRLSWSLRVDVSFSSHVNSRQWVTICCGTSICECVYPMNRWLGVVVWSVCRFCCEGQWYGCIGGKSWMIDVLIV